MLRYLKVWNGLTAALEMPEVSSQLGSLGQMNTKAKQVNPTA